MDVDPAPGQDDGKAEQVGVASTAGTVVQAGRDAAVTVQHVHPPTRSGARGRLDEAASQLAAAVRSQWVREVESRRAYDPRPLRVQWHPVPAGLMDHERNITPGPLPSPAGELDGIVEVYRQVPAGRMLVLGRPGSGKTILAVHFLLTVLSTRDLPGDRVPVLFSLGSWNPVVPLRDWLADQLARDYPVGLKLATQLVDDDRVLPVLDGFDEIADGLHATALSGLNTTTMPLVVTSRPDEYQAAVDTTARRLSRAVAVELEDLVPADRADYLSHTTHRTSIVDGRSVPLWDPVLRHLDQDPDSAASRNLDRAFATPLMVSLARTVYGESADADPAELLDVERFPTARDVEQHLLASWVPAVYRSSHRAGWDVERVEHWLGFLARHLRKSDTPNLAWWRLGDAVPWPVRALVTSVTAGTVAAGWAGLVLGSPVAFLLGLPVAAAVALAVDAGSRRLRALCAFLVGVAFGALLLAGAPESSSAALQDSTSAGLLLATGLMSLGLNRIAGRSAPVPSYIRLRGRPRPRDIWRKARFALVGALAGEVLAVYAFAFRLGTLRDNPEGFASDTFTGLSATLVGICMFFGLVQGVMSDFSVRFDLRRFAAFCVVTTVLFSVAAVTIVGRVPVEVFPAILAPCLLGGFVSDTDVGVIAGARRQLAASQLAGYVVMGGLVGMTGGAALGVVGLLTGTYLSGGERFPGWLYISAVSIAGIAFGAFVGTGAALVARGARVITDFEGTIDLKSATSPPRSLAMDRTNALVQATVFGSVLSALVWAVFTATTERGRGSILMALLTGGTVGIVLLLSGKAWGRWLVVARFWLPLAGKVPWRLTRFLADAQRRGILRQAGAVYQFRHARLQDHYARSRTVVDETPVQP